MWFLIIQICLALFTLLIITITNWICKWRNRLNSSNGMKLPPGSMGLPLIGETIEFIIPTKSLDMPFFLKKRIKRYGTLFKTSIMGHSFVISVDPEFNQFILLQEGKSVELWYLDAFSKLMGHDDNVDDSETKTNVHGQIHKYLRSLALNYIGNESLKQKLLTQLYAVVDENLYAWTYKVSVDLKRVCAKMLFAFTAKLILSYDVKNSEDLSEDFLSLSNGILCWPINVPGSNYHKSLKSRMKIFKNFEAIVKEKIQSPNTRRGDFVDHLIDDMEKENFLTQRFIVSITIALLFADIEALSTALTIGVKFITENPKVVEELEKEYEKIFSNRSMDEEAGLTWEEYKSMTYTAKVINEIFRLSSSSPGILRRAVKDIHYSNGYIIPKGWVIMIPQSGLHLNPDIYEDCLAFKPSRWKENSVSELGQHYIPFGGGGRPCAGAAYSKAFLASFLHLLVTKYRWAMLKEGRVARTPLLKLDGYHIKVSKRNP